MFSFVNTIVYISYYRATEQDKTMGEQDKSNVYEQIKNKQGKQSNITQSRLKKDVSFGVSSTWCYLVLVL
jgi:hypothetical protein